MHYSGAVLLVLWLGLVVAAESVEIQHEGAPSTQQICQPDIYTMLRDMETRLRASEKTVEEQKAVIRDLKEKQEEQAAALRAVGGSVNLTGSQVEELRRDREESRVSFSAALGSGYFGPFEVATPLVFTNILTNIGSAYNPTTGVFTAPVRGVYHFALHLLGDSQPYIQTGAALYKNDEQILLAYDYQLNPHHATPSNGASLQLEVGDAVHVKLWPNAQVRDNGHRLTTFSGHLLFTM
ncbi:hypothetical protein ACEWY4_027801 [Coilia grayii]|uniref:C1q domain-containing protein n=1 Tax=Coilia grayii TaxID=363190 RepID=A0ABD1IP63_9TELE